MKTSLFNQYEAQNELARQILHEAGLVTALENLANLCRNNNISLRDACCVTHQEVECIFSDHLLREAMRQKGERQNTILETTTIEITVTKQLTTGQI